MLTDEVYEHLVFGGARHRSIATLPGMRERTLVVSSAGKTFNVTGWKIGWICGPAPLVVRRPHRQAVPHLRQRRPVPAGDRRRAARCPTSYFTGTRAATSSTAATCW